MVKRAAIFPYDSSSISLLLYKNKLKYEITQVVSPISWGYCYKDAGHDFGIMTHKDVKDDLNLIMDEVEVLILAESNLEYDEFEMFMYAIKYMQSGKSIVILRKMNKSYREILKKIAEYFNVEFLDEWTAKIMLSLTVEYSLLDIPVPVIAVVGIARNAGTHETLLTMKEIFEEKGYSIMCISEKTYGSFFNLESYPDFMIDSNVSVQEKILLFNYYVNELYRTRKPDIIFIEIPGGLFPVTNKINEDFAYQNYLVSNAINFDMCVLNMHFDNWNVEYLNWLKQTLEQKQNYIIGGYIVSNNMINWNTSDVDNSTSYISVTSEYINQYIEENFTKEINISNVFNKEKMEIFVNNILDVLKEENIFNMIG